MSGGAVERSAQESLDDSSAALRAAVTALKAPQAAGRAPAPTTSVYGRAARAMPDDVHPAASRDVLSSRFRSVETSALLPGTTMALVVLPTPGAPPPDLLRSMQQLVSSGAVVLMLGPDMPRALSPDRKAPITIPLRVDDSLVHEWALVACGPQRRVAFLAQKEGGPGDLWSWLTTRDPVAVHRAGTAILQRVPFLNLRVPLLA